jgi:isoquinoline 1-oxidoreductase beta subunit
MVFVRHVSRREFLKRTGLAGGGLVLGLHLRELSETWEVTDQAYAQDISSFPPNVFLAIDVDGTTTIWVSRSEMGQGTRTGMPMIVAEELDADWDSIRILQGDADEQYGHQLTGGSLSTRLMWDPLRRAGASARWMLREAAAQSWDVPRAECRTENGAVLHDASGRRASYGELTEAAARIPVPQEPPLKAPDSYRLLGTAKPRVDVPDMVRGAAVFGCDTKVDGMVYAAIARCPHYGGRVGSFDDSKTRAIDGVLDVVTIEGTQQRMPRPDGVAVIAKDTWTAFAGVRALNVEWDTGPHVGESTDDLRRRFRELAREGGEVVRDDGDAEAALGSATTVVEAEYELPFLAHAPMEPMNCTVQVKDGRCEIWTPTQNPQTVQRAVAQLLDIPQNNVTVHVTLIGGGFGRRLYPDMEMEGALLARRIDVPVMVVWTREDDIRHDRYRPASHHVLRGGLDANGLPIAWQWHIINTHTDRFVPEDFPAHSIANYRVHYTHVPWILPRGAWRATTHSQNPFVIQSFLDELAVAGGYDPLELRLQLLRQGRRPDGEDPLYRHDRMIRVLEQVGDHASWGGPLPAGVGRGVSFNYCYESYVAQVAEVRMDSEVPRVERVVCVVDCGQITNPDLMRAQIEGGVAFGLSAALLQQITVKDARVEQDNFHNFKVLQASLMPRVESHIIMETARPGGLGETPLTPIAGAVGNAIFAASGTRLRQLPLSPT